MNFFEIAGNTVQGGFDAIGNILAGVGKGANYMVSGFFPTPQRDKVISEITAPAGASGMTYRPVQDEMQSLLDLARPKDVDAYPMSQINIPDIAIQEYQPTIWDIMEGTVKTSKKITTVVDEFMKTWGFEPVFTDKATPRAGYPAGEDVTYWNKLMTNAANIYETSKTAAGQLLDQVKGLFNLGYSGPSSQPVFTIAHEVEGTTKLTIVGIAAAIIIAILIFRGRK